MYKPHIDLSHAYWKKIVKPCDHVIDATCGNGHDTLFLAELLFGDNSTGQENQGSLIAIDKQASALESCQRRLKGELPEEVLQKITYYQQCHSIFPASIEKGSVKLIVYNLGYLPGSDKTLTTLSDSTCQSITNALPLICQGGCISITCYPGTAAGKLEEEAVLTLASGIPKLQWSCCHHRWLNREHSPSLLIISRLSAEI